MSVQRTDPRTMFGFLYWVRDRTLAGAAQLPTDVFLDPATPSFRDLRSTLVHELDVERSWRLRLQGAPKEVWDVFLEPSDYPDVATLADQWHQDEADTLAWLANLTDADLASPNTENGLEGFALSTYLMHVVLHGVESFSAAAILLHGAGQSIGDVGFLDFIDTIVGRPEDSP